MAKVLRFDSNRPLSNETATARIREMWNDGDYVPWTHAEDRMLERGYSDADVAYALENGGVKRHRKVDGEWRYYFAGRSVDGRRMVLVFEIHGSFMVLVTVLDR